MLKFSELELIWKGLQAQQQAEDRLAAAMQAIHPDNAGGLAFLVSQEMRGAYDYMASKLLGPEATDWWDWWRFEVEGSNAAGARGWNVEDSGRRYLVLSLEDLFAFLVMSGYVPADPEFAHALAPVEAGGE